MALPFRDVEDAVGTFGLLGAFRFVLRRFSKCAETDAATLSLGGLAALAAVFLRIGSDHPFGRFYLLFLPLIWIATRRGLAAASCAVLLSAPAVRAAGTTNTKETA